MELFDIIHMEKFFLRKKHAKNPESFIKQEKLFKMEDNSRERIRKRTGNVRNFNTFQHGNYFNCVEFGRFGKLFCHFSGIFHGDYYAFY